MTAAWFSPAVAPWFSFLSMLAILEGLLSYADKGKHRTVVMAVWYGVLGLGAALVGSAIVALAIGQPIYVVATLAFSGLVIGTVFASYLPGIGRRYREAELRGTIASDL